MTTWAYDGRMLAADTCQTCDGIRANRPVAKLYALPGYPPSFMVASGERGAIQAVVDWLTKSGSKPKLPDSVDFTALLVKGDHTAERMEGGVVRFEVGAPIAGGSGWQLALGAMAAGASALEAVGIAARFDVYSARPIDCVEIGKGIIVRHS